MQGMFASTFDTRIGTPCEACSTNYTEGGTGPNSTYGEFRAFLDLTDFRLPVERSQSYFLFSISTINKITGVSDFILL